MTEKQTQPKIGAIVRHGDVYPLVNVRLECDIIEKEMTIWWDFGELRGAVVGYYDEIKTLESVLEKYNVYGNMATYPYINNLAALEFDELNTILLVKRCGAVDDVLRFLEELMHYEIIDQKDYEKYVRILYGNVDEIVFEEYKINDKNELEITGKYLGKYYFYIIVKASGSGLVGMLQASWSRDPIIASRLGITQKKEIPHEQLMMLAERYPIIREALSKFKEHLKSIVERL